jgi:hypothetical protein
MIGVNFVTSRKRVVVLSSTIAACELGNHVHTHTRRADFELKSLGRRAYESISGFCSRSIAHRLCATAYVRHDGR